MSPSLKRIAREPLLHFLALGALLFAAYSLFSRGAREERNTHQLHVSQGELKWLRDTWVRQWEREPTREELQRALTDFVREELLAREARHLGLDENDTFIRRWLAQKMQFLVQDTARLAEPSAADLHRFYEANQGRFVAPARISFTQIFFDPGQRKDAETDARSALASLRAPGTSNVHPAPLGDSLLLPAELSGADQQTVSSQFGQTFAQAVFALHPGSWSGPISSGYGLHLVRVSSLEPARLRDFEAVKGQVLERWRTERQRAEDEKYFAGLLKKYDVVLDDSVKPLIGPLVPIPEGDRAVQEVTE